VDTASTVCCALAPAGEQRTTLLCMLDPVTIHLVGRTTNRLKTCWLPSGPLAIYMYPFHGRGDPPVRLRASSHPLISDRNPAHEATPIT
jgi:hypothetical protein